VEFFVKTGVGPCPSLYFRGAFYNVVYCLRHGFTGTSWVWLHPFSALMSPGSIRLVLPVSVGKETWKGGKSALDNPGPWTCRFSWGRILRFAYWTRSVFVNFHVIAGSLNVHDMNLVEGAGRIGRQGPGRL